MESATIEMGRFAPFPSEKRNFKIKKSGNSFTRTFQVKFSAPMSEIHDWIQTSESLNQLEPIVLTSERMLLPYPENFHANKAPLERLEHEFYRPNPNAPSWWDIDVIKNGLKYQVPYKEGFGIGGPVVINQDTETVYINISWS